MENKCFVIINPIAGNGKAKRYWPNLKSYLEKLKIPYERSYSTERGQASAIAGVAVSKAYKTLLVLGGDGTFNEVINGVKNIKKNHSSEIGFILFPCGTGNDWLKTSRPNFEIKNLFDAYLKNQWTYQDVACVAYENGKKRYFVNSLGIGIEGFIAYKLSEHHRGWIKNPYLKYLKALLLALQNYKARDVEFLLDGNKQSHHLLTLSICLGKYKGGGMMIAPKADLFDGVFHTTLVSKIHLFKVLRKLKALYNGNILEVKGFESRLHQGMEIQTEGIPMEAEGEYFGQTPAVVSLEPKGLKILAYEKS